MATEILGVAFLKLSRNFFECDLWRETREFSKAEAWLDLIRSAAFAPETTLTGGRCLNLQPGELVASVRYLSQRWGWSKSKVERFLELLREARRIETGTGTRTSVIRLCNYEKYNSVGGPVRDTNEDAHRDRGGTVARQSIRTDKNGKNERTGEAPPPVASHDDSEYPMPVFSELPIPLFKGTADSMTEACNAKIEAIRKKADQFKTPIWSETQEGSRFISGYQLPIEAREAIAAWKDRLSQISDARAGLLQ